MEYKCQTVKLDRMIVTPQGFINPLCESCKTLDCSNPIEKRKVSIIGVTKVVKIYSRGQDARFVVQCEGYMP